MKRINYSQLFKKSTAIVLVAAMTTSVIMSYDKAGQLFDSIRTVFADEVEDAEASSAESEAPVVETTAAPVETTIENVTPEEKNETDVTDVIEGENETGFTDIENTEPAETETTESTEVPSEPENNETKPAKPDIKLKERRIKAEGEDIYVSGLLPADVKVTAEKVEIKVSGAKVIAAYDIKVFDKEGNEWQPAEPLKIEVASEKCNSVTKNETEVIYVPDELAESGKPVDIKNKKVEKIDSDVKNGKVEFEAGHFSVYVIIEHEDESTVVTPRVKFHFISADFGSPMTDGNTSYYAVDPYEFYNKSENKDKQNSQILKDDESLELIADPVNTATKYFYGWYVVDPYVKSGETDEYGIGKNNNKLYYTWPDKPDHIAFEKPISISEKNVSVGDTVNWSLDGVTGSGAVDKDGNVHVLVAPVYENYHFVNFMQFAHDSGAGSSASNLMTRKLLVFGGASSAEVKVSDVAATSTDAVRLIFKGWEYYDGTDWVKVETIDYNGNELKDPGKDGKYIPVTGDIDLYPIFIEARWADFNVGISGNGATYVESRYLMTWKETGDNASLSEIEGKSILTKLDAPTRKGYDFGGWYVNPDHYDTSTGEFTGGTRITETTITDGKVSICTDMTIPPGYEGGRKAWEVADGKLKFYYGLSRLTLYAKWIPAACNISVVYWTENVQDKDYVAPADPKDDYTSAAVKTITTTDLNAQLGTSYVSGSTLPRSALEGFQVNSVSILDRQYLDEAGAVPQGEEKFYDLDTDLSDSSVVINGDGTTVINVFFKRKVFKLVFHIGRDGYVKSGGHQKPADTPDTWDGNWIEYMFNDSKVRALGYTNSHNATDSYSGTYSMSYKGNTYDSTYVTTNANVMGDYDPADDEANLYVIKAKYGAYIGDRWPSPSNPRFTFAGPNNSNYTLYIWAAYFGSLYCRIANDRNTVGNIQGANPDINGVYQYMSAELCSNRAGDAIINENQVHHLVAWFGQKNNNKRFKQYHILYEAIPGTYDPNTARIVSGNDYQSYNLTTWSQEHTAGDKSEIAGRNFIELSDSPRFLISNLEPQFQLVDTPDGYELFYSCYNPTQVTNKNISGQKDYHIYFFFRPKQYNLTFMYENEADRKTDTYYYTQSLADANKYDPTSRTGYEFLGWYTNEAGIGEPFDFANSTMPAANVLLYPVLRALKYKVEIDPNGGEIDHINHNETSSYDGSGRGAFNRGVLYKLDPVTGQQVLDDQNQPIVERPADSEYRRDQSTYFNGTYGERIGQYTLSPKNYVQLSDKDAATYRGHVYYYVNMQYKDTDGGERGLPSDLRNALYVDGTYGTGMYKNNDVSQGYTELYDLYDFYYKVAEANKNNGSRPDITLLSFDQWKATYVSTQKYRHITESEHWTFMGWYRVYDNGSEASMPYNFNDPVYGEIKLRAKWRLDGGIYIKYNPYFFVEENGQFTAVIGDMKQWTDPALPATQLYADQSLTNILRAPTHVTENWVFRGWRVVRPDGNSSTITVNGQQYTYQQWTPIQFGENGNPIYYSPGDDFTVNSALVTQTDGHGGIIHMQAYYERVSDSYRRPDVTNLILDANNAHDGYVNETDSTLLPALSGPGSSIINTTDHMDGSNPTQILLGDFQSNISLHLYRYATTKAFNEITGKNFFTHKNGYLLLGFDENSDPNSPTTAKPYIPAYAADSVIAVTRNDARTLYAMWEPMVYVTFVNTTDAPITINLSGSGNSTISIVNKATGEFNREAVRSTITVPAKSGDEDGVVKIVLPGAVPGTDTITATATNDHFRKIMSVRGKFDTTEPYGTGSDLIPYGGSVTYTGTLMTDPTGIIVTYTEEPAKHVIYDVNGGVWTETSTDYYHASGDLYTLDEDKIVNNSYRPSDPTLSSKIFIGWTTNADIAAHTDFSSDSAVTWGSTTITPASGSIVLDKIRSSYLWDFSQQPPYNQTLYAVWSDTVMVTFNICYRQSQNNEVKNHIWNGPATVSESVPYEFCDNDPSGYYITYMMAKGETVPKPQDPSAHADFSNAYFFKWLIYSSSIDSYRYTTKNPQDGNLSATSSYVFDFSKRVNSDTKLITSWIKTEPQVFTFTIENHVTGGSINEEFDYTIAVSGEQVDKSNKLTNVDNQWGSVTTKLKNGETYTVRIKVCFDPTLYPENGGCYSATMEVIDRDGNVIKSSPLLKHSTLSKKYFTTSCKYTLSISQAAKTGYDTTLEDGALTGTIIHDTNSANRTFTFTVMHGSKYAGSNQNEYVAGDNSLTLIFTNRGSALVTPTGVASSVMPYVLMLTASLLLAPFVLDKRRRKKKENE